MCPNLASGIHDAQMVETLSHQTIAACSTAAVRAAHLAFAIGSTGFLADAAEANQSVVTGSTASTAAVVTALFVGAVRHAVHTGSLIAREAGRAEATVTAAAVGSAFCAIAGGQAATEVVADFG